MSDLHAAAAVLRERALQNRENVVNNPDADPWDVGWWEQQAHELEATADLLDACAKFERHVPEVLALQAEALAALINGEVA